MVGAVDFRAMYRRHKDTDLYKALPALSKELAEIARDRRVAPEQLTYVQDQRMLLRSTTRTALSHSATETEDNTSMTRSSDCAASPFAIAMAMAADRKRPRLDDDEMDESFYLKVTQVAWEDDILWGFSMQDAVTDDMNWDMEEGVVNRNRIAHAAGVPESQAKPPHKKHRVHQHRGQPHDCVWMPPVEVKSWTPPVVETGSASDARPLLWGELETVATTPLTRAAHDASRPSLPCALNRELDNGSWIDAIGWLSPLDMPPSKLVLDANDESLVWAEPSSSDRPILRVPVRQPTPMETRKALRRQQAAAKVERLDPVMMHTGLDSKVVSAETKPPTRKVVVRFSQLAPIHHSLPAIQLVAAKAELSKSKLRAFHRPRAKFGLTEHMVIVGRALDRKPVAPEANTVKRASDLHPAADGKLILVEYTEQNPPMLGNPGMASRLVHYCRDAHRNRATCTPSTALGLTINLAKGDASPFIGDVPIGDTITALESPMYTVPLVQHDTVAPFSVNGRDRGDDHVLFLICRGGARKDVGTHTILELPPVFVAGQVAPKVQVPAPQSRAANKFIRSYLVFHVHKLAKQKDDGRGQSWLKMEHVARAFPHQPHTAIRKCLRELGTFERTGGESGSGLWKLKTPTAEKIDDVRAGLSPEDVCLYESMMAGQRRLLDVGLTKQLAAASMQTAIERLEARLKARKEMLVAGVEDVLEHLTRRERKQRKLVIWKRDALISKLEQNIRVARFIHEELELTSWNLTNNFVECHRQGKGSLALSGMGDPSGRGEGFSFVRESRDVPTGAAVEPVEANASTRSGTTSDLRKLKKKEMLQVLRNLGVPDAKIKNLPRWDLVALIRDFSGAAATAGHDGPLSKFARDERRSGAARQQKYRARCDTIFKRQLEALRLPSVSFPDESSDEAQSDDDSELLDSLEEELFSEQKVSNRALPRSDLKSFFSVDGSGINRSKEAVQARQDELELAQLLEDLKDDKIPSGRSSISSQPSTSQQSSRASSPRRHTTAPLCRKVVKRTTRVVHADGTESVHIEFLVGAGEAHRA